MKTKDYLEGEHQVKMYPKRDSGIKAPHNCTLTLNFKWFTTMHWRFIIRNKIKCIHKYIKLLYYKQRSLLLQRTPSCKWPQGKGKAVPLQVWSGPEGSRKLRFPDFMTMAQDGGKVVSLTHWPPLPPRKCSWYSFLLKGESTPRP